MSDRPRPDPRRQHLRRQRRARRHRGVAHRPDRPVLVRHALPVDVGADRERRAAERALDGRPAVLRDALLPRARDRHGLRRREALGDPPARGRRRLPRGADDPQPRREAGRRSTVRIDAGCDFADLFEVKDALKKKGTYSNRVEGGRLVLGYQRETFARDDGDLGDGAGDGRREGPHLHGARLEPHGAVDDRPRRRHGLRRRGESRDAAEARAGAATAAATWRADLEQVARRRRRGSSATGTSLRATYRRSLVDLAALRFSPARSPGPEPAGRRAAVVHDHVRPRQHLHEPAGAAVHAGAGGDDAARARRCGRARGSTTSATRIPGASCTRCATAR